MISDYHHRLTAPSTAISCSKLLLIIGTNREETQSQSAHILDIDVCGPNVVTLCRGMCTVKYLIRRGLVNSGHGKDMQFKKIRVVMKRF